jgi:hypothetical protein
MSLHALASYMATKGRGPDTMLVHMAPEEVASLQALAERYGGTLTLNPDTGLPEAKWLKKLLPAAIGAALNFFVPGVGTAIGAALGTSAAVGTGIAVGGITALATGSLSRGLTAGLGAYGGASLASGLTSAGTGSMAADAIAAQQAAGTFPTLAEGATQAQIADYASQVSALRDTALANAGKASLGEKLSAGLGAVAKDPKLYGKSLLMSGYAAAAPVIADQVVETTTKMPDMPQYTPSPAYYRPYEYDPETKGLRFLGAVEAKGLAGGGMVAFADGGTVRPQLSDQGRQLYNQFRYDEQEKMHANMANNVPTEAIFDFDKDGLGANWRNIVANDPAKAQQLQKEIGWGGNYQDNAIAAIAQGLGSLPAAAAPKTVTGGISDLVYRPLSEVDEKARAQGLGSNPLNDRKQGLEKVMIDRGLIDEMNRYGVNAGGHGKAYNPVGIPESVKTDNALQNAYYDAIRNDLSEAERQRAAGNLLGILKQYEDRNSTLTTPPQITSTEAIRPTTEITPSTYTVQGEQIAPQTPTTPPAITSTMAARPVAAITPAQLYTQQAAAVPLTSTAPPVITASAAPTMPSLPVGGGGAAGAAAIRPFDYQSVPIERLPEFDQQNAENVMTGESLAAYQRLIGIGARSPQRTNAPQSSSAGYVTNASQSSPVGYVTNPFGQRISSAAYRFMNGPTNEHPETLGLDAGRDPVTGEAYQWAWKDGQWHVAKSNPLPSSAPSGGGLLGQVARTAGKVLRPSGIAGRGLLGQVAGQIFSKTRPFAQGGPVPGYALGGLGSLGGYSDGGQLLKGPGDGVSDSIPATIGDRSPARLADGEFVVPARIVSELGNGSTEAGARKLYTMMDRVQRARSKTIGENHVAVNSRADQYLPA